jgi:hypothetical protein
MNKTWKQVSLGDLLTAAQQKRVAEILVGETNSLERIKALKEYLRTLELQLEPKGVLPDYLAYWLEYQREHLIAP